MALDTIVVFDPAPGPATGPTVTYRGNDYNATGQTSYTVSGATLGAGKIVVGIAYQNAGLITPTGTVDGQTLSVVNDGTNDATSSFNNSNVVFMEATVTSATGDIVINFSPAPAAHFDIDWWRVENFTAWTERAIANGVGIAAPWTRTPAVNVGADGAVLLKAFSENANLNFETLTNIVQDKVRSAGNSSLAASQDGLAAETPRTVTYGDTDTGLGRITSILVSLE